MAGPEIDDGAAKRRIVLAKIGFDGHDRGVKVLAASLRDGGYDVVYLGKYLTPEAVVAAALEEDAGVIGLSFLGGAHVAHCREIGALMQARGLDDIVLLAGGVIPAKDVPALKAAGVGAVFPADTPTGDVVAYLDGRRGDG